MQTFLSKRDWVVTTPTGETIVFKKDTGLYKGMPCFEKREHQDALGQTVQKNFEGFTRRQVKKAILARKQQAMLGHPSDQKLKQMVSRASHWWKFCVTPEAISHARAIFVPNRPGLSGKTVRVKPERVEIEVVPIP